MSSNKNPYKEAARVSKAVHDREMARIWEAARAQDRRRRQVITVEDYATLMVRCDSLSDLSSGLQSAYATDDAEIIRTAERAYEIRSAEMRLANG